MYKILVGVFLFLFIIFGFPYYTSETIHNAKIVSKEVKKTDGNDLYLVYIQDDKGNGKTYKIADTLYHFQYRSSDLYLSLKEGDIINFSNYGFRIPLFSIYENIYNIEILNNNNIDNNVYNDDKEIDNIKNNIQDELIINGQKTDSNDLYFFHNNKIFKYNIANKSLEVYDENILK